jgi:hypothetical protein
MFVSNFVVNLETEVRHFERQEIELAKMKARLARGSRRKRACLISCVNGLF